MTKFHILTLFPEMVLQGLSPSIIGRAAGRGLLSLNAVDIRDYTLDRHGKVDDYPYGGGAGMLRRTPHCPAPRESAARWHRSSPWPPAPLHQEKQRLTERLSRQKRDNIHMMESLSRGRADILYTDFRGQDTAVL